MGQSGEKSPQLGGQFARRVGKVPISFRDWGAWPPKSGLRRWQLPNTGGGKTARWRVVILAGYAGQFIMSSRRAQIQHHGLSDSDSGPLELNGTAVLSGPIGDMLVS